MIDPLFPFPIPDYLPDFSAFPDHPQNVLLNSQVGISCFSSPDSSEDALLLVGGPQEIPPMLSTVIQSPVL